MDFIIEIALNDLKKVLILIFLFRSVGYWLFMCWRYTILIVNIYVMKQLLVYLKMQRRGPWHTWYFLSSQTT